MSIAFLATGDEIIHGDTLNTNSHNLAKILSSEGIPLGLHLTTSDKEKEILSALDYLNETHNILIIIGGLGPTSDDRTRFALATFLGEPLVEFSDAIAHIQQRIKGTDLVLSQGNKQQALFPQKTMLLANPNGTAMGGYLETENKVFILLPGPPRECLPMFNDYVLPLLQKQEHSQKEIIKWRVFGVAEAEIAEKLEKVLVNSNCKIGYRLETPYVECKISCKKDEIAKIKELVQPVLEPYIISSVDKKASDLFYEKILSLEQPIHIWDEVTGGLLQNSLQKPESYAHLKFYPDKQSNIAFHIQGLEEYWASKGSKGSSELCIQYQINGHQGEERHQIPYRSPLVVFYAVEFLSFRLLKLINQFH
ncbi:MAG: competence/damage-inducible protein A [Proteobacteria bacterium]|nr:competence/damage-inducible protein A [Pseudomonadota bacterium]